MGYARKLKCETCGKEYIHDNPLDPWWVLYFCSIKCAKNEPEETNNE